MERARLDANVPVARAADGGFCWTAESLLDGWTDRRTCRAAPFTKVPSQDRARKFALRKCSNLFIARFTRNMPPSAAGLHGYARLLVRTASSRHIRRNMKIALEFLANRGPRVRLGSPLPFCLPTGFAHLQLDPRIFPASVAAAPNYISRKRFAHFAADLPSIYEIVPGGLAPTPSLLSRLGFPFRWRSALADGSTPIERTLVLEVKHHCVLGARYIGAKGAARKVEFKLPRLSSRHRKAYTMWAIGCGERVCRRLGVLFWYFQAASWSLRDMDGNRKTLRARVG
ncbi:hypothetical protein C8R45DRAFT_940398 [Mycena sanguinolenta]|nr:hypothetical protein C8R45DRAFT_940398 [Mycena sanguinolenta]